MNFTFTRLYTGQRLISEGVSHCYLCLQSFEWSIYPLLTYRIHFNYLYIRLNIACIYNIATTFTFLCKNYHSQQIVFTTKVLLYGTH